MEHGKWRTATIASILLLIFTGAWGLAQHNARRATERTLTARYQERFFEAVSNVENIEVLITKGLLAITPERSNGELSVSLFSDLWRQAFAAQANLNQLPLVQGTLMRTSKFLTQIGDFGYYAARKIGAGEPFSQDELAMMQEFKQEAAVLNSSLREAQAKAARGIMPWSDIRQKTDRELAWRSQEIDDDDFTRLEKQATEFPTMIYDGPFSDHILQRKPKGLTGEEVSEAKAEVIALDFTSLEPKQEYVAETVGKIDGDIPAYQIRVRSAGSDVEIARLDISQKGGHVVWMINARVVGKSVLSLEEAGRKAKDFLVARGFEHIIPTYANYADGRAVIPFAPLQDNVIIYPDLIKVSVALDNGEVVGYEALGYLMNHHTRNIPRPKITADEAMRAISPQIQIVGVPQLALIPLETLEEVLAYEIKGQMGDAFFAHYVDAQTGKLIRILQIVDTPEGPKML
ncbi:MAG TPA: germination protein YpeB [Firmicutes bacterium]|jgi:spore germination protein|nr:germination protein YpeB [Bacillota bacterium]